MDVVAINLWPDAPTVKAAPSTQVFCLRDAEWTVGEI